MTLHNWIWILTFWFTCNRLLIYCNRLHYLKIILERYKSFKNILKTKLVTGNRLQKSNHSGNLENLRKFFCKTKLCYLVFEKKYFNTYPIWSLDLLLLDFFSWILNLGLDSWCLILKSWINYLGFWHHQNCLVDHHEACFHMGGVVCVCASKINKVYHKFWYTLTNSLYYK